MSNQRPIVGQFLRTPKRVTGLHHTILPVNDTTAAFTEIPLPLRTHQSHRKLVRYLSSQHQRTGQICFTPTRRLSVPHATSSACDEAMASIPPAVAELASLNMGKMALDESSTDNSGSVSVPRRQEVASNQTESRGAKGRPQFWTYSLYRGPGGRKIPVHYCRKIDASERIAQLFLGQKLLGFDLEWRPNATAGHGIKKNVSLVQLASEERIALFHIALHNGHEPHELFPPTLKRIMEDPEATKIGVAISADCSRLRKFFGVESRSLFELSHLYKVANYRKLDQPINKRLVSLAKQVEEELDMPMFKGEVRSSDWSKELVMEQIIYAASDAYASLRLYEALDKKRRSLDPTPPLPHHAELGLPLPQMVTQASSPSSIENSEDEDEEVDEEVDEEDAEDEHSDYASLDEDLRKLDVTQVVDMQGLSISDEPCETTPPDLEKAEQWVSDYRNHLPAEHIVKVPHKNMLAYALWHQQGLEPQDLCDVFERPLKPSTIAIYILDVVSKERFVYDTARLSGLVRLVPYPILRAKYSRVTPILRAADAKYGT